MVSSYRVIVPIAHWSFFIAWVLARLVRRPTWAPVSLSSLSISARGLHVVGEENDVVGEAKMAEQLTIDHDAVGFPNWAYETCLRERQWIISERLGSPCRTPLIYGDHDVVVVQPNRCWAVCINVQEAFWMYFFGIFSQISALAMAFISMKSKAFS